MSQNTHTELSDLLEDMTSLLDTTILISNKNRSKETDYKGYIVSGFLNKQLLHSYTILRIANPISFPQLHNLSSNAVYFDFSSASVLLRASIDNFIKMCYLLHSTSEEESNFKLDLWKLHGFCEDRKFYEVFENTQQNKLKNESLIQGIIKSIKNSKYYEKLEDKEKQSLDSKLKNNAEHFQNLIKILDSDKVKFSGIHKSHLSCIYTYTSAYVHSVSTAIEQILTVKDVEDTKFILKNSILYSNVILSLNIIKYSEIFDIECILNDSIKVKIEYYKEFSESTLR